MYDIEKMIKEKQNYETEKIEELFKLFIRQLNKCIDNSIDSGKYSYGDNNTKINMTINAPGESTNLFEGLYNYPSNTNQILLYKKIKVDGVIYKISSFLKDKNLKDNYLRLYVKNHPNKINDISIDCKSDCNKCFISLR